MGGGVVGCSLAYHLSRAGMRPLLLERGELGAGSTARYAGGVRQQFSTEMNVRIGMLSRRLLEAFEDEVGSTADLRQIGYLLRRHQRRADGAVPRNVAMQQAVGLDDVRLLDREEVAELVPELNLDDVVGGTYCPSDGLAGPNEVTPGTSRRRAARGASVVDGTEVDGHRARRRRGQRRRGRGRRASARPLVVNCAGPVRRRGRRAGRASTSR